MPREVDDKKTKRALRKIALAKAKAAQGGDDTQLNEWESEFVDSVEERLDTFGSAFNDPEKGALSEPLSARQNVKLREIEKKAKGKARKPMSRGKGFTPKPGGGFKQSSFKRKGINNGPRVRDINDDIIGAVDDGDTPPAQKAGPRPRIAPAKPTPPKTDQPAPSKPKLVEPKIQTQPKPETPSPTQRPTFRVVKGGKDEDN